MYSLCYTNRMKLLWSIDTKYTTFEMSEYNEIIDNGDVVYLPYSGEKVGNVINIQYITVDKITGQYNKNIPFKTESVIVPETIFYSSRKYIFGDKEIRIADTSRLILECWQNNNMLWRFKAWAYLYTDIIEKNGCIIFGTDGMGSRLYCVDLETGELISETKTHFSGFYDFREFSWHNGNLVIYGKNALTIINPFSGEIIDEHKIPTKYLYRCFLKVIGDYAYCCVTTDNNRPTILCFAL